MSKLYLLAENIRSVYNVGSFFRTADAAGVDSVILTGLSAHPPHPRLEKTALNAEKTVAWEYYEDAYNKVSNLKEQGVTIISLEITENSTSLFSYEPKTDICLIVGNEVDGVSQKILDISDQVLHIPMLGEKASLNVSNAAAVALYHLQYKQSVVR